jgi:hypothetical protein
MCKNSYEKGYTATRGGLLCASWKHAAIAMTALIVASPAFPCGGIFDVGCNLQHGGMSPQNMGNQAGIIVNQTTNAAAKAGQDVANALNELQASVLTGPVLEQAIRSSHDTAVNGAVPIPPNIRQELTGYASEASMNQVRYKIGDNGFVNLARLIEQSGSASAVTLIDVVIFRGPSEAQDPSLWAHELTHVDQYREWGLRSFAVQYTRNANSVEDPAYAKEHGYLAWAQQSGSPMSVTASTQQPPAPIPAPTGWPSGTGMQACGCWGPTTGFNQDGRCASGAIIAIACAGSCGQSPPYAWMCR